MNIKKLQTLIPASFEYKYKDAQGVEHSETIVLGLRRMSFSAGTSKELRKATDESDADGIADILAGLIGEWNMDADGEPFPPTAENIKAAPIDFVTSLSECVFKRLFPDPQKANDSDSGSEPAASSVAA